MGNMYFNRTWHFSLQLVFSRLDEMNRTAVHWAALGDQHEILQRLIEYKCNPSAPDHAGDTALQLATWYCHLKVCSICY